MPASTPISSPLSAAGAAVGSYRLTVDANQILVTNRVANETFLTVDGSLPVVNAANTFFLSGVVGAQIYINLVPLPQSENPTGVYPLVQAIATTATSVWIEVN